MLDGPGDGLLVWGGKTMEPLEFDDGSVLEMTGPLSQAYLMAFGRLDLEHVGALVVAATDYFWETRRVPTKRGEELAWEEPFAKKSDLAGAVLGPLLNSQRIVLFMGVEKYNLVLRDPDGDTTRTLHGKEALEESHKISLIHLGDFAFKGYFLRGLKALREDRSGDARAALEEAAELNPDDGQNWFWLGIARQRTGDNAQARPAFRKAAMLLESPHIGSVACPECGWIPCGQPLWKCDGCGAAFDTFETRARCPRCEKTWEVTLCIACRRTPRHSDWWRKRG